MHNSCVCTYVYVYGCYVLCLHAYFSQIYTIMCNVHVILIIKLILELSCNYHINLIYSPFCIWSTEHVSPYTLDIGL